MTSNETLSCSENPNSLDTISRQAAIDDLHGKDPSQIWDTADIEVWLNALPSAQPERKRGKWISPTPEMLRGGICGSCEVLCSVCKTPAIDDYDFCPNCGADMREEKDGG